METNPLTINSMSFRCSQISVDVVSRVQARSIDVDSCSRSASYSTLTLGHTSNLGFTLHLSSQKVSAHTPSV